MKKRFSLYILCTFSPFIVFYLRLISDYVVLLIATIVIFSLISGLIVTEYVHGEFKVNKFLIIPEEDKSDNTEIQYKKLVVLRFILVLSIIFSVLFLSYCVFLQNSLKKMVIILIVLLSSYVGFLSLKDINKKIMLLKDK